ncbi:MAG: glucodextranase DOMON-like domain-containing protein [Candidatus Promineifilaceae bacterium]
MMDWRCKRLLAALLVLAALSIAGCVRQDEAMPTAAFPADTASTGSAPPADVPAPELAVTASAEAPAPTAPPEEPLYLSIIWHQHQPVYYKDLETNVYERPWVRMHAAKDYVDMAAILEAYPDIHATFNLTPSLIAQLDDFAAGARDSYWMHTEIPAEELTDEQKQFILDRFFDTNRRIIERFPRYAELLARRDASEDALNEFTTGDYRDLQILFNLAWTDPDWLAAEPLAGLVAKGSGFDEADKAIILAEHLRLIEEVVPLHRTLQDAGQIEVTTTPFAHPILPLLVSTDLAREALPDIELPAEPFIYGQDAMAQVERGVAQYEEKFGRAPRGMWPAEGAVAEEIVTMVGRSGIQWMASDEGVLAKSLGLNSFTRNSAETVVEAGQLYRPYLVDGARGDEVAIIFRDAAISDKVGFTYSGQPGERAAADFVARIHAIHEQLEASGAEGPHLVSVILDGENAWEYYENDGKEFLHTLYRLLSDDPLIKTVTPSEFLALAPQPPLIEKLYAGSWINADFSTWIGEEEENRAWDYLATVRAFLQQYISGTRQGRVTEAQLAAAIEAMMYAEGSDWFWWYGADQTSSDDGSFDQQYRSTLKQVYLALGEEPPKFLDVPIIPELAVTADRSASRLISPTIDGIVSAGEWEGSGQYLASGGAMAAAQSSFDSLLYGFDGQNLYLAVNTNPNYAWSDAPSTIQVYFQAPGAIQGSNFGRGGSNLGFPAIGLIDLSFDDQALVAVSYYVPEEDEWISAASVEGGSPAQVDFAGGSSGTIAVGDGAIEMAVPLTALGPVDEGSRLNLRVLQLIPMGGALAELERLPFAGPATIVVPDLGTTELVLEVADPEGDDHGPGTYIYPTDSIFSSGNFDLTDFQVGSTESDIVFKFTLHGPVENVWDSPNGLSLQTLDVYIDTDGDGQGGEALLPGRNLALDEGMRWDYAVTSEGWTSGIYTPGVEGPQQIGSSSEFDVLVDPDLRKVTLRVPKAILGDDPQNWRFAAMALSQEGYPSGGVMRVRDVLPGAAEQWKIGGAPPAAANYTRVMDLVWPEAGQQEAWLSDFVPVETNQAEQTAADYARIPLLDAE